MTSFSRFPVILLNCPPSWSMAMADMLMKRLVAEELPSEVIAELGTGDEWPPED